MAASVAFFGFFSLFPLLVAIVAVGSLFLEAPDLAGRLEELVANDLPGSESFVRDSLSSLIELRGAAGIVGVLGLLWSGSKMFGAITRSLNLTFGGARDAPFYASTLRQFAVTVLIAVFAVAVIAISAAFELLGRLDLERFGIPDVFETTAWSHLVGGISTVTLFLLAYRLIPRCPPTWRQALPGALLAAGLFEAGKAGFAMYVENVGHLNAVYGTLASASVLMLWLYISARMFLLGGEFIVVLAERR